MHIPAYKYRMDNFLIAVEQEIGLRAETAILLIALLNIVHYGVF